MIAQSRYQLEMTKMHPDMEQLRMRLAQNPYRGADVEDPAKTVYTLQELQVQYAST